MYPPILKAPVPFGADRIVSVAQDREIGLNPVDEKLQIGPVSNRIRNGILAIQ